MKSLIFNDGKPMFSPNLKELSEHKGKLTPLERQSILSEIELMDTMWQWYSKGNDLGDSYKELAMTYAAVYDDKIALSNLLLTFQGAIVQLDVDRKSFIEKKGESEKTAEAFKRNQMFMRVHQEFAGMIERNNQMMLMLKNALEKVMHYKQEVVTLKKENDQMKNAFDGV